MCKMAMYSYSLYAKTKAMNSKILILFLLVLNFTAYKSFAQSDENVIDSSNADKIHVKGIKAQTFSPFGAGNGLSNFISNISVSSFFKEGVNGKIELQGKFDNRWSGGISIDQRTIRRQRLYR